MPEPLARLFLSAAGVLVDELHARLRVAGWPEVRPAWGFILSRAGGNALTVNDLAASLGITKQAASKAVQNLQATGLVELATDPHDARIRRIELTAAGRRLNAAVETAYADLEAEWAAILGHQQLAAIREGIETVLRRTHDGELPPPRPMKM